MKKLFFILVVIAVAGAIYYYNPLKALNPYRQSNWDERGYIAKNNPGMEPEELYIIYEKPGSPALTKKLRLDKKTVCYFDGEKTSCNEDLLGKMVEIQGYDDNGIILVNRLTILTQ